MLREPSQKKGEPKIRAAAVLGIAALTALAGWVPVRPFYLTNDDVAMRLLVEGRFAADMSPTPFVLFMHPALGWGLASLYTAAASVPWYDILMFLTAFVASVALIVVWRGSVGALLLSLGLLTPMFATPQFSIVGMTCAAAGSSLLASACGSPAAEVLSKRRLAAGTALLLWSSLIRWEGTALLIAQTALSMIAVNGLRLGENPIPAGRIVRAAAVAMLVPIGAAVSQVATYQRSAEWHDFPEFNSTRGFLTEYASQNAPSSETLSSLRAATGWSANDLYLLRNWFFVDPTVFSLAKLRTAAAVLRRDEPRFAGAAIRRAAAYGWRVVGATGIAILFMAAIALSTTRPRRAVGRTVVLLIVFLAAMVFVSAVLKEVPFRVYWPALVLVAGLTFDSPAAGRGRGAFVALVIAAGLLCVLWSARSRQQQSREAEAQSVAGDVTGLRALSPALLVIHGDALRWEFVWRPFVSRAFPFRFIAVGASAQTPPVQSALRRAGANDPVGAVCANGVVLIARAPVPDAVATFLKEHTGRVVSFDVAFSGNTLTGWRCRVKSP
jgi:hypothetical protein